MEKSWIYDTVKEEFSEEVAHNVVVLCCIKNAVYCCDYFNKEAYRELWDSYLKFTYKEYRKPSKAIAKVIYEYFLLGEDSKPTLTEFLKDKKGTKK